jgi:general secretion pathway protein G
MNTNSKARSTRDKGFTLVELLIVIVILGVLATVTVFAVRGISSRGQLTACQSDKATLDVAVEAYFAQNGTNAANEQALVDGGFLKSLSSTHDVSATGAVTPTAAGKCAGTPT